MLKVDDLDLINRICSKQEVYKFIDVAKVDVGMVTGANNFFLVDNKTVAENNLDDFTRPMFGRSEHCKGVIYDHEQHLMNQKLGHPTNFVCLEKNIDDYSANVRKYIRQGELQNLHTRYKCRIRKPWYKVPSIYSTKIGMLKRSHDVPRLIYNEIEALTTDTGL